MEYVKKISHPIITFRIEWENNSWEIKNYRSNGPKSESADIPDGSNVDVIFVKLRSIRTENLNINYNIQTKGRLVIAHKILPRISLDTLELMGDHFIINNIGQCLTVKADQSVLPSFEKYKIPKEIISINVNIYL